MNNIIYAYIFAAKKENLQSQKDELKSYATKNAISIKRIFADCGSRTRFFEMIALLETSSEMKTVLLMNESSLAESVDMVAFLKHKLSGFKATILSTHPEESVPNPFQEFLGRYGKAQREYSLLKLRESRNLTAENGYAGGGPSFGTIPSRDPQGRAVLVKNPLQERVIKKVFHYVYDLGLNLHETARRLNSEKHLTMRDKPFYPMTVRNILTNKKHQGILVYAGKRVRIPELKIGIEKNGN
jgi:DNA invertase Pin-like site-specific DNA recombinase